MLSAAIRVLARSASIQVEEAAALAARPLTFDKGKGKAEDDQQQAPPEAGVFGHDQSLEYRLAKHGANYADGVVASSSALGAKPAKSTALDRLISNAPRAPPPPAPDTHPADKGDGIPIPLNLKIAGKGGAAWPKAESKSTYKRAAPVSTPSTKPKGKSALDSLIGAAPRQNPPPAPDSHPSFKFRPAPASSSLPPSPPPQRASPVEPPTPPEPAPAVSSASAPSTVSETPLHTSATAVPLHPELPKETPAPVEEVEVKELAKELEAEAAARTSDVESVPAVPEEEDAPIVLRASKVPSSRIGRLFHYGSLAASLSFGAATESIRRTTGGNAGTGSVFMSDANVRRLVSTLGRMRGAALKLGQFMSIQDNHMLPPEIEKVLHQVQAHANYMPDWQMEKAMREELGPDWQSLFTEFDRTPIASASIGQVHRAVLASTSLPVAVKIQFPGVSSSIESDLSNLSLLLRSSALLPKGLYLQNTIAVMRRELEDECDYVKEAAAGRRFSELLAGDEFFVVPKVVDEATTGKVLTTEWMDGKPLSRVKNLSQKTRDKIGTNILRLCLQELFQFRFMQTDPNWGNFMYSSNPDQIQLLDFGASREYTKEFMDGWYRLLKSALEGDREAMRVESLNLGYLTGEENDVMLQAHIDSMALVASPFSYEGKYPFANQTITDSIRALIPVMLKHRLTPPPQETYSLNRKLSGAFLMCAKLGAHVDCKALWEKEVGGYKEG
ncbi:hypothetical protein IAT38_001563 [Cryptococcus sp. DSM 104549]